MGRSSVYNRLKLDGIQYLKSIGYTGGWGIFIYLIACSLNYVITVIWITLMQSLYVCNKPNRLHNKAALNVLGFRDN